MHNNICARFLIIKGPDYKQRHSTSMLNITIKNKFYTILEQNKISIEPMNKYNNISVPQLGSVNK